MAETSHPQPPGNQDELLDRLIALLAVARLAGNPITVKLLEMALLNEKNERQEG